MAPMRIALFGLFGGPNLGNEATIFAFLHHLRKRLPDAEVVCIAPRQSAVTQQYGLPRIDLDPLPVGSVLWRVHPASLQQALRAGLQVATELARARRARGAVVGLRALIVPGTGIVDDFGQGPLGMPLHLLRWSGAARREAAALVFASIGVDRVQTRLARLLFRRALRLSTYRSFRDDASRAGLAVLGVPTHGDPVYPDLAFSLPEDALPPHGPVTWPPHDVGVGVMGYRGWNSRREPGRLIYETYLGKLKEFVAWLLSRGYAVRLLTGDTRADEEPLRDLVSAFGPVAAFPAGGGRLICEPISSFHDLLRQIACTDLVVATRFHNVLLSLMLARPAISVGYSAKNAALMAEVGLAAYSQDIEALDIAKLIRQFEAMTALAAPPVVVAGRQVRHFRRQLDEQYDRLFDGVRAHR
jgi:polysaccharide pyruvyl transferase WcaK-like protein